MNPLGYLRIAGYLVVLASWPACYLYGYSKGANAASDVWQARESKELASANVAMQKAVADATVSVQHHMDALTSISSAYQTELQNAETQHTRDVAAIRTGAIKLRDSGATTVQPCPDPGAQATTPSPGRDAPQGCELSSDFTEFLLVEADLADRNTEQLSACQSIVIEDRK